MVELKIIVRNDVGLHARPAALFVQEAQKYNSTIKMRYGNREVNAKSILGILGLGVGQDMEITITAEGLDENQAIASLKALIEKNFDEPVFIPNSDKSLE
jgi:phosphotransferase system HPr (HPr) family protein